MSKSVNFYLLKALSNFIVCIKLILYYLYKTLVLDKTLKGIRGVRPDNRIVFRAPSSRNKYLSVFFIVQ